MAWNETEEEFFARFERAKGAAHVEDFKRRYPNFWANRRREQHWQNNPNNVTDSRDPLVNARFELLANKFGVRRIYNSTATRYPDGTMRHAAIIPHCIDPKDEVAVTDWERRAVECTENQERIELAPKPEPVIEDSKRVRKARDGFGRFYGEPTKREAEPHGSRDSGTTDNPNKPHRSRDSGTKPPSISKRTITRK